MVQSTNPAEYRQLIELVEDLPINDRYRALAGQAPELLLEEIAWLAVIVRQALLETAGEAPWVVLYLTLAYKTVLCSKLEHRLNPRRELVMPSPFVYAMQ
jgi:hypothetical protein